MIVVVVLGVRTVSAAAPMGDFDANGFVDYRDYLVFEICCTICGPGGHPYFQECVETGDYNSDGDVDLADFAEFQRTQGHLPMLLRDYRGAVITVDSTEPYSGRHTCGYPGCHDSYHVTSGSWFQDGRTDVDHRIDMRDDYNEDGRYWIKSAGRYGIWGQTFQYLLAAKENTHPSQIDQPTFNWTRDCSGCHTGAGPGEFDRDGEVLWNAMTGEFGYQVLGKTEKDVFLDGDYSRQDYATGEVTPAPWDVTGVSGPDCLFCHRQDRPQVDGTYLTMAWRRSVQMAGVNLVDDQGASVPAFAAAGTAGQGWFSMLGSGAVAARTPVNETVTPADVAFLDAMGANPYGSTAAAVTTLQIDYSVGVANKSLMLDPQTGELAIARTSVGRPKDLACWSCHPYGTVTGTTWFDDRFIHYRKFTKLIDDDPVNDIPPDQSRVCKYCHPGNLDHDRAKGGSVQLRYRDELDWKGFRTCRNCHLTNLPDGSPNVNRHPDAPHVPGDIWLHLESDPGSGRGPFGILSCQACHIPYAVKPAVIFRDITVPGSVGMTPQYYSTDPLRPWAEDDDSRWYPALVPKVDVDGQARWFPANIWITVYFGDWNQNGTPHDYTDDVIAPIFTWRVAQIVGDSPLPCTTDDDGDGRVEINRLEEILPYLNLLQGEDANGQQVAANPVLVRGWRVFYLDPDEPEGVGSFEHVGAGIAMDAWYPYIWSLDHNVLPAEESWGYHPDDLFIGCEDCHTIDNTSPFLDRLILVDPLDENGKTIYKSIRELTGLNAPMPALTARAGVRSSTRR